MARNVMLGEWSDVEVFVVGEERATRCLAHRVGKMEWWKIGVMGNWHSLRSCGNYLVSLGVICLISFGVIGSH